MADTNHYATDKNEEGEYIPKSYQFERDLDIDDTNDNRHDTIQFEEDANDDYLYLGDIKELYQTEEGLNTLRDFLENFADSQVERLNVLESYSIGENYNILEGRRRLEEDKADYRARHAFGYKITRFMAGYIAGNPITVESDENTADNLSEVHKTNKIDKTNKSIVFDSSRYGRAFEIHYYTEDGLKIKKVEPQDMFVIRSADLEKEIIGAVHLPKYNGEYHIDLYTNERKVSFNPVESVRDIQPDGITTKKHSFGDVPVVEWHNNDFKMGDWESEISLIDLYDSAESDTANYMSDLVDALLVVSGDFESSNLSTDDAIKQKQAGMLLLQSGTDINGKQTSIGADYIYKQYDSQGQEAYKSRVKQDFYDLVGVPNFSDEKLGSVTTQTMMYKMIDLMQTTADKQTTYTEALERRYELISKFYKNMRLGEINIDDMKFVFHPNLPNDVWEEISKVVSSGGELSQETMMNNTSFTDFKTEQERLKDEQPTTSMYDYEMSEEDGEE